MSYNTAGQLRQINAVNSDGTTGAVQYKYAYRGDGKRAWKEDANGNRTFFYYDGEAMLAYSGEADFSARLVLWGPDGVVGQQWRNSNNTTGSQYFLYDAQGNLAQTVGGDGAVSGSIYAFTAWGESVKNADGTVNTPGGFGYGAQFGYFRDGESGFYLCTYRHYDPSAGRWITRDPIRYGGGPNLYGYAWNDPANLSDPKGLFVPLLIPLAVGASVFGWGTIGLDYYHGNSLDGGKIAVNSVIGAGIVGVGTAAWIRVATTIAILKGRSPEPYPAGGFFNGQNPLPERIKCAPLPQIPQSVPELVPHIDRVKGLDALLRQPNGPQQALHWIEWQKAQPGGTEELRTTLHVVQQMMMLPGQNNIDAGRMRAVQDLLRQTLSH